MLLTYSEIFNRTYICVSPIYQLFPDFTCAKTHTRFFVANQHHLWAPLWCDLPEIYLYIIITEYWLEVPLHVKLTDTDDQIIETLSIEFDLMIRACQRDVIRHLGWSFCNNGKFYYIPFKCYRKTFEIW